MKFLVRCCVCEHVFRIDDRVRYCAYCGSKYPANIWAALEVAKEVAVSAEKLQKRLARVSLTLVAIAATVSLVLAYLASLDRWPVLDMAGIPLAAAFFILWIIVIVKDARSIGRYLDKHFVAVTEISHGRITRDRSRG